MTAIFSLFVFRPSKLKVTNRIVHTFKNRSLSPRSQHRSSVCWVLLALGLLALTACRPANLGSSTNGWSPATANDGVVYVATQGLRVVSLVIVQSAGGSTLMEYHFEYSGIPVDVNIFDQN